MRRAVLMVLVIGMPALASAQTTDAGFNDALSGSMAYEHYANLVVYMRLKGHVPPSTARAQHKK